MPLKVTVGTVTDRGLNPKRTANEDRLLALPQARLFLVADGVGGRRGGQVASQTVVDVFKQAFSEAPRQGNDLLAALKQTISLSNRSIHDSSTELIDLRGMATTVALVAALNDNRAIIGHVGDSRVYRFDGRDLICETEDHSEVNDAVRAGTLSAAQAAHHPRRNVINRAIGAEPEVEADFKIVPLNERTSFLLCSDGITRHVNDAELTELMRAHLHPQKFCTQLKDLCYERGAEDNLTAVVVDFGERSYADTPTRPALARAKANANSGNAHATSRFQVELGETPPAHDVSAAAPVIDRRYQQGNPPPVEEEETLSDSARLRQHAARETAVTDASARQLQRAWQESEPPAAAASNSSITFWDKPAPPEKAAAQQHSAATPASAKPAAATSPTSRGRDFLLFGFYVFLLTVAFGLGRYYDELLSWINGEPVPVLNRANGIAGANDPELAAARALFEERRFDKARERLLQLAAAQPENAAVRYWLGRASYELKLYPEAVKVLGEAARLDATLPGVYVHLALAQLATGADKRNVEESLRKALQ